MKLIRNFGAIVAACVAAGSKKNLMASAADVDALVMMGPAEDRLESLRQRHTQAIEAIETLNQTASDEDRDLTDDELDQVMEHDKAAKAIQRQIDAQEVLTQHKSGGPGRRTSPTQKDGKVHPTVKDSSRFGFKSFGEFAVQVRQAQMNPRETDGRLLQIASTYANEGTGADGGYLVPPEFRRDIWTKVMGIENLFSRTTQLVTASNNLVIPKDETTPWDTTKGVQVFWESEGGQISQSKPVFDTSTLRLNKLTGLVPVSEELLQDAPGLESWLRAKVPMKMAHKINRAVVRGTGVGQPLGILNAASLISASALGSQPADSVWYRNILDMWARMPTELRSNAVWLVSQDVETQLYLMQFQPGSSTPVPVFLPAGGASGSPFATLMGRPVIPVQSCSALGDQGDIILVDLTQYFGLTKGQEIQTDVSMHFFFDQALMAFRFILRIGGQPIWGETIAPEFGSTTRSWAVTLDERT